MEIARSVWQAGFVFSLNVAMEDDRILLIWGLKVGVPKTFFDDPPAFFPFAFRGPSAIKNRSITDLKNVFRANGVIIAVVSPKPGVFSNDECEASHECSKISLAVNRLSGVTFIILKNRSFADLGTKSVEKECFFIGHAIIYSEKLGGNTHFGSLSLSI